MEKNKTASFVKKVINLENGQDVNLLNQFNLDYNFSMFSENVEQEKDSLKTESYKANNLIEVKDKLGSSIYLEESNKKNVKK